MTDLSRRRALKTIGAGAIALGGVGAATAHGPPSVTFENQNARGVTVNVASTFLPEGGFVVIHDLEAGGAVVGHTGYKQPGHHEDLRIPVDVAVPRANPTDHALLAMAHRNTGRPSYDFPGGDPPYFVKNEQGKKKAVVDPAKVTFPAFE